MSSLKRHGACIHIMNNVFKDFNIKARLYDIDSNLIYKHDPVDYKSMKDYNLQRFSQKFSHLHTKSQLKTR